MRVRSFGGLGVDGLEKLVEGPHTPSLELKLQVGAEGRVGGDFRHLPAFEEGPHVLTGAADEDWQTAPTLHVLHRGVGLLEEQGKTEGLVGFADVQQMMRDQGSLFQRRFGGSHVHAPVDLPAVGVDDFSVELAGDIQSEGALAHGGGPNDGYDGRRRLGEGHVRSGTGDHQGRPYGGGLWE